MPKKRAYHFSCGDSTTGPVGFCASIKATSKRRAVEILRSCIPEAISVERTLLFESDASAEQVEYFNVYLNPEGVTVDDIDGVDD